MTNIGEKLMSIFDSLWQMVTNPFILVCGGLQITGGIYAAAIGDWKLGIINFTVGIANSVLSTMKG
jgi:CobQ-like glutamine amidotransferase family enzyme